MENKVVTISTVEPQSKNGRSWKKVIDGSGKAWMVFPSAKGYQLLEVGKTVKLTLEQKGEYTNVTLIELASQERLSASQQGGAILKAVEKLNEDLSRNRSMSFSYAKDLVVAGVINPVMIFRASRYIEGYITTGKEDGGSDWLSSLADKGAPENKEPSSMRATKKKVDPDAVPL